MLLRGTEGEVHTCASPGHVNETQPRPRDLGRVGVRHARGCLGGEVGHRKPLGVVVLGSAELSLRPDHPVHFG